VFGTPDAEPFYSYEGTREINKLIVGRAATGMARSCETAAVGGSWRSTAARGDRRAPRRAAVAAGSHAEFVSQVRAAWDAS
jgi:hypothetical protein